MVLRPNLTEPGVELTGKCWVVNDPTGRWREFHRTLTMGPRRTYHTFKVYEEGDSDKMMEKYIKPLHTFKIYSKLHLWVEQCKDQWIIREYRLKQMKERERNQS